MTAINLDHKTSTISTDDNAVLQLQTTGGVKIGTGLYLDELDGEVKEIEVQAAYKGAIRYNDENGCLQYCDGTKWININGRYNQTSNIVWSLLF